MIKNSFKLILIANLISHGIHAMDVDKPTQIPHGLVSKEGLVGLATTPNQYLIVLPRELIRLIGDYLPIENELTSLAKVINELNNLHSGFGQINRNLDQKKLHQLNKYIGKLFRKKFPYTIDAPLDKEGTTLLWQAACYGENDQVEQLLAAGAQANKAKTNKSTPLIAAAQQRHDQIFEQLVASGVDIKKEDSNAIFHAAIDGGSNKIVQVLLDAGIDVNKPDDRGEAPLVKAVVNNRSQILQLLLAAKADIHTGASYKTGMHDRETLTPLMIAARNYNYGMVIQLLAAGAHIEQRSNNDNTALSFAAEGNNPLIVEYLLAAGARVNNRNKEGRSPIHMPCTDRCNFNKNRHLIIQLLLAVGANLDTHDFWGFTPLDLAIHNKDEQAAKLLVDAGAPLKYLRLPWVKNPLLRAAENCLELVVKMLLQAGANPNTKDNDTGSTLYDTGSTPLHAAAEGVSHYQGVWGDRIKENYQMVTDLLEAGAEIDSKNNRGQTPLYLASRGLHENVVRKLLQAGANPNEYDKDGQGPLHATIRGYSDSQKQILVAWQLIAAGADCNHRDKDGNCPLHMTGNPEVINLLLKAGADPSQSNKGILSLHRLARDGNSEAMQLVLAANVDINQKTKEGETPMHYAVEGYYPGIPDHHIEAIQLLKDKGSNINLTDNGGKTPLFLAAEKRYEQVVKLLLSFGADKNIADANGKTPLKIAQEKNYSSIVKLF